jgi:hypothetical protein
MLLQKPEVASNVTFANKLVVNSVCPPGGPEVLIPKTIDLTTSDEESTQEWP